MLIVNRRLVNGEKGRWIRITYIRIYRNKKNLGLLFEKMEIDLFVIIRLLQLEYS